MASIRLPNVHGANYRYFSLGGRNRILLLSSGSVSIQSGLVATRDFHAMIII